MSLPEIKRAAAHVVPGSIRGRDPVRSCAAAI